MTEHCQLAAMRAKHPDWVWNRSDTHVILGVPGSLEGMKAVVEPGNSFSPGAGTFGVSTWVFDHQAGRLHAPEEMPLEEMEWRFLEGCLPVLISTWRAGLVRVSSRLFTDGDADLSDIKDYLRVELHNAGEAAAEVSLYVVVRSFGAAGGPVKHLELSEDGLHVEVNHFRLIYAEEKPDRFGAVSYAESGKDICHFLRQGQLPEAGAVEDSSTWASGAMEYRMRLKPGEATTLSFVLPVKANDRFLSWVQPPARPLRVAASESELAVRWRDRFAIGLEVPDERFRDAFFAQLTHLLMFTVYDAPRISPISYPIWWLRDGVYVVNALDKGGFHEFAGRACRAVMHRDFFGGFGSEGDGPGEAIWMLTEHYLLSRDESYLRDIYPHVKRKAELVMEMRRTERPMKRHTEFTVPKYTLSPWTDLLCLPPREGLIMGRMDGHYPVFWVNGHAYLGMRRAAECARLLGEAEEAEVYDREAAEIRQAMARAAEAEFGNNARDLASALWPTGWASEEEALIRSRFYVAGPCPSGDTAKDYWNRVRRPEGRYAREPLWTYFEAAQAHNYLLLGEREKAWLSIERFLTTQTAPGLYTYHEGAGDENSFLLWQHVRGWDVIRYVTPHGWTAAELFHLLRACMVYEKGEALVIGAGVPESWVSGGQPLAITNAPTHFGKVSWRYLPGDGALSVEAERAPAGGLVIALPGIAGIEEAGFTRTPSGNWQGPLPVTGSVKLAQSL